MSSKSSKTKILTKLSKEFARKHPTDVLDIILFGSLVRGKDKPSDIDVLVLFKNKKNRNLSYDLRKQLETVDKSVNVTPKTYAELFEVGFKAKEAVLSEGISLVYEHPLAEGYGFDNWILFKYSLQGRTKSERMLFYYALNGRGKKDTGVLDEIGAIRFSDGHIICPVNTSETMKKIFARWNLSYTDTPLMIPSRMRHVLGPLA